MEGLCFKRVDKRNRFSLSYQPNFSSKQREEDIIRKKVAKKSLFRTTIDRISKKEKDKKTIGDNVYEVIVIKQEANKIFENKGEGGDIEEITPFDPNQPKSIVKNDTPLPKTIATNDTPILQPTSISFNETPIPQLKHISSIYTPIPQSKVETSIDSPIPPIRSRRNSSRSITPPPRRRRDLSRSQSPVTPPPRRRRESGKSITPPPRKRHTSGRSIPSPVPKLQNTHENLNSDYKEHSKPPLPPPRTPARNQKHLQKELQSLNTDIDIHMRNRTPIRECVRVREDFDRSIQIEKPQKEEHSKVIVKASDNNKETSIPIDDRNTTLTLPSESILENLNVEDLKSYQNISSAESQINIICELADCYKNKKSPQYDDITICSLEDLTKSSITDEIKTYIVDEPSTSSIKDIYNSCDDDTLTSLTIICSEEDLNEDLDNCDTISTHDYLHNIEIKEELDLIEKTHSLYENNRNIVNLLSPINIPDCSKTEVKHIMQEDDSFQSVESPQNMEFIEEKNKKPELLIISLDSPNKSKATLMDIEIVSEDQVKEDFKSVSVLKPLESSCSWDNVEYNHLKDIAQASNKAVNFKWDQIKRSSSWSSNIDFRKPGGEIRLFEVRETHFDTPNCNEKQADTSYICQKQYAENEANTITNEVECPHYTRLDRVRSSLEKLDIPTWYRSSTQDKPKITTRPLNVHPSPLPGYRQRDRSLPNSPLPPTSPTGRSLPSSPLPPTSPTGTRRWREQSLSPSTRSSRARVTAQKIESQTAKPYTGWRSEEKLPVFFKFSPSKVEQAWRESQTNLSL